MSEFLSGIIGVLVGGIITGSFLLWITRMQVRHQEREARISRLIQVRSEYLIPLRQAVAEWNECQRQQAALFIRFKEQQKVNANSPECKNELQLLQEAMDKGKELWTKMNILRAQLTDPKLDDLIKVAEKEQYNASLFSMHLIRIARKPQGAGVKADTNVLDQYDSIQNELRQRFMHISKRIEELLSGE